MIDLPFDFNSKYKGYFPACRFTAAGRDAVNEYLAGTDAEGNLHLFSSISGEVWTEHNLMPVIRPQWLRSPADYGDVIRILFEEQMNQLFLVTDRGCVITVPDCPKCVRARRIETASDDVKIVDAVLEQEILYLKDAHGKEYILAADAAATYRCSYAFAKEHIGIDGLLFDLREPTIAKAEPVPAGIPLSEPERLQELLWRWPKERYLFFVCERGVKAEEAAKLAREMGIAHACAIDWGEITQW